MYRACLHLIKSEEGFFCLKVREWNEPCPPRCPWHVPVTNTADLEADTRRYQLQCRHCTRILATHDEVSRPVVYCTLLEVEDPTCEQCELVITV